jgi:ATP-dependent Clp protease ATP-binding subunit ClpA
MMGARPMARVIQLYIKTPLADEVLFGKLKNGGTVRVVVADENGKKKLAFMYPEGPALPKPDKEVVEARKKRKPKEEPEVRRARAAKTGEKPAPEKSGKGDGGGPRGGGIVPQVPLKS